MYGDKERVRVKRRPLAEIEAERIAKDSYARNNAEDAAIMSMNDLVGAGYCPLSNLTEYTVKMNEIFFLLPPKEMIQDGDKFCFVPLIEKEVEEETQEEAEIEVTFDTLPQLIKENPDLYQDVQDSITSMYSPDYLSECMSKGDLPNMIKEKCLESFPKLLAEKQAAYEQREYFAVGKRPDDIEEARRKALEYLDYLTDLDGVDYLPPPPKKKRKKKKVKRKQKKIKRKEKEEWDPNEEPYDYVSVGGKIRDRFEPEGYEYTKEMIMEDMEDLAQDKYRLRNGRIAGEDYEEETIDLDKPLEFEYVDGEEPYYDHVIEFKYVE